MAEGSFERAVRHVLRHEGGFADHPRDPGGATKYGITRATLAAWRGRPVTRTEVRRLTRDEACRIYRARYWEAVKADALPAGVDYCVFDAAVNSGPGRAARWLQAACRVAQDGIVGKATLAAAGKARPERLIDDLCDIRLAFLKGIAGWETFGRGWERRVGEVRALARTMAREAAEGAAPPAAEAPAAKAGGVWAVIAAFLRALLTGAR